MGTSSTAGVVDTGPRCDDTSTIFSVEEVIEAHGGVPSLWTEG